MAQAASPRTPADLEEWSVARFLFRDSRMAWLWLVVRLYLGYQWLDAGLEKVSSPVWTGAKAGTALAGFLKGGIAKASGDHPAVQDWYASFLSSFVLPNAHTFSYIVAFGELLVGVGLIVGALTGVAAFFGIVMNANYLLAGTVSTNPILAIIAVFVVLAWRNAGWIGVDRFLLPALGTPWQRGAVFNRETSGKRVAARA